MAIIPPRPASVPPITLSELMQRLADQSGAPEDIFPYLIEVASTGKVGPGLQPNPSRVIGLDEGLEGGIFIPLLNNWFRRARHRAYRQRITAGCTGPRIVSEGDSWFQYPTLLKDVIDHLMSDHAVFSLDAAGDTLTMMIEQNEIGSALASEGASVLLLSAGGNDLFENGNIANLVEPSPDGAPVELRVGARFQAFLEGIMASYRSLLLQLHAAHPDVYILFHGYCPAFSRGGRYIGRPLRRIGVRDAATQNAIIRQMLIRFNSALTELAADDLFNRRLRHVDLSGIGGAFEDWHDEIHLNDAGYGLVADRFRQEIARVTADRSLETAAGARREKAVPDEEFARVAAIAAHAGELAAVDEPHLMLELQRRMELLRRDPSVADLPDLPLIIVDQGLEGSSLAVGALAQRLVRRWERELHELICGDTAEDAEDRKKLLDATKLGQEAFIGALTVWLATGPLSVPSVLAGVLGAILIKRFAAGSVEVLCQSWKERIAANEL